MAEDGDDLTNCPVCFEEYTEKGGHVPRLLPCSHTICEKCLEELIHNNKVDCPECRIKHEATSGKRSFPQNKYIITHLHRIQKEEKKNDSKARSGSLEKCPEHDREKTLFCREPECLEPVCPICLARFHKQHKYVDIEAQKEKCEPLLNDMDTLQINIQEHIEKLIASREEVEAEKVTCVTALKARKEEIINKVNKKFDTLFDEAEALTRMTSKGIDENICSIVRNVKTLTGLRKRVKPLIMTDSDITINIGIIQDMITESANLWDVSPKFVTYNRVEDVDEMLERLCGRVTFGRPDDDVKSDELETRPRQNVYQERPPKTIEASDFKFQGDKMIFWVFFCKMWCVCVCVFHSSG